MNISVSAIILNFVLIVMTSFFTVSLAFWRFQREKKWEFKARAYQDILNALLDIKKTNEFFYKEYKEARSDEGYFHEQQKLLSGTSEEARAYQKRYSKLLSKKNSARSVFEKTIYSHAIYFREKIYKNLTSLCDELNELDQNFEVGAIDEGEYYDKEYGIIDDTIKKFSMKANRDLSYFGVFKSCNDDGPKT